MFFDTSKPAVPKPTTVEGYKGRIEATVEDIADTVDEIEELITISDTKIAALVAENQALREQRERLKALQDKLHPLTF